MNIPNTFGERLRDLRKEKNLLQSEFGELFGLSPSAIGSYERNLREPQYKHLVEFADFFKVSTDFLLCRTTERLTVSDYTARDTFELTELLSKYTIFVNAVKLSPTDKQRISDIAYTISFSSSGNNG